MRWTSIYEAPIERIIGQFKEAYGVEPNDWELMDILLDGKWRYRWDTRIIG